ncbi:MAG: ATP-binding cassette domain-containing protein [Actinomycetes bacterium]|jgi:peptide/nickel transport system ATP-binding protein|nr:ATP-binding cassette domain-containing protein [Actinomycetes bacterium]
MHLSAQNVSFGYRRERRVLNGLDFCIRAGERVALTGPSGCGKSTLSQLLAGYLRPQSGQVTLGGDALPHAGYSPVQLIYQHPERAINPRWRLRRTLHESWHPDAQFLDTMGIAPEWLERYPVELSGGEIQRFCIARALAPQTRFLIADEMTTMLDMVTQAQIWECVLEQVTARGLGLLVVTHSEGLARRTCDRVVDFRELTAG